MLVCFIINKPSVHRNSKISEASPACTHELERDYRNCVNYPVHEFDYN